MILNLFIGLGHFYLELSVVSFFVACSFARIAPMLRRPRSGSAAAAFHKSRLLCRLSWIGPRQNIARQESTNAGGAMPHGFTPPGSLARRLFSAFLRFGNPI